MNSGHGTDLTWLNDETFSLRGTEVQCTPFAARQPGVLQISKTREMVEATLDRLAEFRGGNMVELGIRSGGGTAMVAVTSAPRKLVALDIDAEPVVPLDDFVDSHGLDEIVTARYGIDQADPLVGDLVDGEFDGPIDVVIDDASHLYAPTRASFECLFPRLRPGGAYLIEDWRWEHHVANTLAHVWEGASAPEPVSPPPDRAAAFMRAVRPRATQRGDDYRGQLADVLTFLDAPDRDDAEPSTPTSGDVGSRLPLTRLVVEIMLVRASSMDVVDELVIGQNWVAVRKGHRPLDPSSFTIGLDVLNVFGQL